MKLKEKVAIVTGAAKGIGAGIAKAMAKEGAKVVVNYAQSKEAAERIVAEIIKAGGQAVAIQADVSKRSDVTRLFAETKKAFGQVDVVVNNAGRFDFGPLEQTSEESIRKQFETNVFGTIFMSQEAVKNFPPNSGNIVNISSIVGANPGAMMVAYAASKAAVDAVTKSLSKELGPKGIRVNAVSPGQTLTEGTSAMFDGDARKAISARTPLGRLGEPEDVALGVVFLASDEARWITGEILRLSGGVQSVG